MNWIRDIGHVALAPAVAAMVGAAYFSLRRHQHVTPRVSGELAVLCMLRDCGSLTLSGLRACGVDDAHDVIENLVWGGYVEAELGQRAVLFRLTELGRLRVAHEQEETERSKRSTVRDGSPT